MDTRLIATLLATLVLAGCASTANNYSAKGILLDNGSYYFPAQDGQGDYYYEEPSRPDTAFTRISFDSRFGFGAFSPFYGSFYGHACGLRSWGCSPWPYWYGSGRGWLFEPGDRGQWQAGQYDPHYRDARQRDRRHGRLPFPTTGEDAATSAPNGLPEVFGDDGLAQDGTSPVARRPRRQPPSRTNDEGDVAPAPRQRADRSESWKMPSQEQPRPRIRESGHDGDGQ